jgi:hypothetical protein
MENQEKEKNNQRNTKQTSKLAVFSLLIPLLLFFGGILIYQIPFVRIYGLTTFMILSASPIGIILSILALIRISKNKAILKGRFLAISGMVACFAMLALLLFLCINFYYAVFHEEPYGEPESQILVSKVENNYDLKFPEKMAVVRTADKISAGIDRPYVFILRFITDQNGFKQFKEQIKENAWEEISSKFYEYNNRYLYDTMSSYGWKKNNPEWCQDELLKGLVYENGILGKSGFLNVICIKPENSDDVEVIMMGWANQQLKDANEI